MDSNNLLNIDVPNDFLEFNNLNELHKITNEKPSAGVKMVSEDLMIKNNFNVNDVGRILLSTEKLVQPNNFKIVDTLQNGLSYGANSGSQTDKLYKNTYEKFSAGVNMVTEDLMSKNNVNVDDVENILLSTDILLQPNNLNIIDKLQFNGSSCGEKSGSEVVLMEHQDFSIVLSDAARKKLLEDMLVAEDINKLKLKISELEDIIEDQKKKIVELSYDYESFKDNDKKTKFYTGLPCFNTAKALFELLEKDLPLIHHNTKISKFQMFLLTLMKLRNDFSFRELGYKFNVSESTASHYFHKCLFVMYCKLKHLIVWPTREQLWETTPAEFKEAFGSNFVTILDCFEVYTEMPSDKKAAGQLFSSYKHHHTIKILLGITPHGAISFVSNAFVGRASDKFVTQKSKILDHILVGDIVMADRGFLIEDSLEKIHAHLKIPAFTRSLDQLHPIDVEKTRKIAHIRIHVERKIGETKQKFLFLDGKLPISMISKYTSLCDVPVIDQAIVVACALINLCPGIIVTKKKKILISVSVYILYILLSLNNKNKKKIKLKNDFIFLNLFYVTNHILISFHKFFFQIKIF